jgi:tetratricopeptide (TPR) repeat protein
MSAPAGARVTRDARGCAVSGANPRALEAFERAVCASQSWRTGAEEHLAQALREAPGFVMAHAMQAHLMLGGRDARRVQAARPLHAHARGLPANARERMHLAAIEAVLDDDYDRARTLLGEVLREHPRDAIALQVAHSFDYITGDSQCMQERVRGVLPAWSGELPGFHAVLSMHAFSLVECGEYERAEAAAREALAHNPRDARAHHVMAHVFEMTRRPESGVQWMNEHRPTWSCDTVVATHCWWHLALFHLAAGRLDEALSLYDTRVRAVRSRQLADLVDAVALLWRIRLQGVDAGDRWGELAEAWEPYIEDRFCTFNDLHAMMAFVGASDWHRARRLLQVLGKAGEGRSRHGYTTRQLGLPATRAFMAFGQGLDARALELLARVPPHVHRIGGSHAQRDVLHLTMLHAIDRLRRPQRWGAGAVRRPFVAAGGHRGIAHANARARA